MPKLVHPDAPTNLIDVDDDRVALFRKSGWVECAEPVEPDEPVEPVDDRPAGNASLTDWVEYAKSFGKTEEELHGFSRDDIRNLFK